MVPLPPADAAPERLDVLKALGDNTRYAIYLELARAPHPRSTAEVADTLGLHPNTVRPHLERMREVGLLLVSTEPQGAVGRPQHRYALAPDAPSLGLEPPAFPVLARSLLALAASLGAGSDDAADAGRAQGRTDGHGREGQPCLDALCDRLADLGFDPTVATEAGSATVAFAHCPFQDLAEARPDLVCGLHQGLVEGFVEQVGGGRVEGFRSLADRNPCQVDLSLPGAVEPIGATAR